MNTPPKDIEKLLDKAWDSLEAEPRRRAEQIKAAGPIHGAITPLGFRK